MNSTTKAGPRVFTPEQFVGTVNQMFGEICPEVLIGGEVANLKISQGKWVFFDLKDRRASVPCFMWASEMRTPLEDGMKAVVKCQPQIRSNGNFSLTVRAYRLAGEGSIKKAYEMLKKKLMAEGLFDPARKRAIPRGLKTIGIIMSTGAAGYADFVKIVNARWGGMKFVVAQTQVQGMEAPRQMVRALKFFNERANVEAIVMIRGGGSADDLACYNDEELVRAVAASKIPVMTGVGHEVDEVLVDLAADARASTPSNAAELLTFDRKEAVRDLHQKLERAKIGVLREIEPMIRQIREAARRTREGLNAQVARAEEKVASAVKILNVMNPETVLRRGYAIIAGKIEPGSVVKITTLEAEAEAEIKQVRERS